MLTSFEPGCTYKSIFDNYIVKIVKVKYFDLGAFTCEVCVLFCRGLSDKRQPPFIETDFNMTLENWNLHDDSIWNKLERRLRDAQIV